MAIDRDATVKKADELIRQGKIALAIEEYVRLVEEQPDDFGARNTLGDLYARSGDTPRAVEHFTQIAAGFLASGFVPKAIAIYKKALKLDPVSDVVLWQLAQVAIGQKLLADATLYLNRLLQRRREQGNEAGVAECLLVLGDLPSATPEAKLAAARAASKHAPPAEAARRWIDAADLLAGAGRAPEALDALVQAVSSAPVDAEVRRRVARECLALEQVERADAFLDLESAAGHPELLLALARRELRHSRENGARTALDRFVALAPERRSEADALLAPMPDVAVGDDGHEEQPTALVVDRIPVAPVEATPEVITVEVEAAAPVAVTAAAVPVAVAASPAQSIGTDAPAGVTFTAADSDVVDLSAMLGDAFDAPPDDEAGASSPPGVEVPVPLAIEPAVPAAAPQAVDTAIHVTAPVPPSPPPAPPPVAPPPPPVQAAPMREADHDDGDGDAATIRALEAASRTLALRFQASAELGRLFLRLGRLPEAITWLEQAVASPAPVREHGLAVMYELADALERGGHLARALDVLTDLDLDAASYRDVRERMSRLTRAIGHEHGR